VQRYLTLAEMEQEKGISEFLYVQGLQFVERSGQTGKEWLE
jgi:hypothetical protein